MPETIAKYRDFIDYGADGVFGAHSHCPQGWEDYKGKPIFYSLGNFFFNSKESSLYRVTKRVHWYEGRCVILSIKDQQLSWEVINTRNVDNIALEVDHSEESVLHNEYVCHLLMNKQAYDDYVFPLIKKKAQSDMREIESTFQPKTIKQSLRALFNCIKGKKNASSKKLLYVFRNDLRRAWVLRLLLEKL